MHQLERCNVSGNPNIKTTLCKKCYLNIFSISHVFSLCFLQKLCLKILRVYFPSGMDQSHVKYLVSQMAKCFIEGWLIEKSALYSNCCKKWINRRYQGKPTKLMLECMQSGSIDLMRKRLVRFFTVNYQISLPWIARTEDCWKCSVLVS